MTKPKVVMLKKNKAGKWKEIEGKYTIFFRVIRKISLIK